MRSHRYCPPNYSLNGGVVNRLRRPHTLKIQPGLHTLVVGYLSVGIPETVHERATGLSTVSRWQCLPPVTVAFAAQPGGRYELRGPDHGTFYGFVLELVDTEGGKILWSSALPEKQGSKWPHPISAFACRRLGGTLRADGVETLEVRFIAPSEFGALQLAPWARTVLPHVLGEDGGQAWIPPVTWVPPPG